MMSRWFFAPVPLGRVAALRTLAYLFIPIDVLYTTRWILAHKDVPGELYRPLFVGRLLHLPTPTHTLVVGVCIALLITAILAAFNRWPRALGAIIFVLYFEWMIIAQSYGKVDHDRFAYLVLLAALPTIGAARWGDEKTLSERAGWAMKVTQIAVICTYFLASLAKFRFGGAGWVNSAVMTRAVVRRGTDLVDFTLEHSWILIAMQWFIVAFELGSPIVLFVKARWQYAFTVCFYAFHLMVYLSVRIIFLPHLIALATFLPLEKVRPIVWAKAGVRRLTSRPLRVADSLGHGASSGAARKPVSVSGDQPIDGRSDPGHGRSEQQPA